MRREASVILLTLLSLGLLPFSFGPLGVRGGPVELFYDDGGADQGDATLANMTTGWGVLFDHPEPGVAYRVLTVTFYVFLEEAPLRLFVYLHHSPSGYRKVYEEVVDSVEGWNVVDLSSSDIITDGSFIVGVNWVVNSTPFLGVDTDTWSHSGTFQTSNLTAFNLISGYFNYMIRASVVSTMIVVPDDYVTIQEAINVAYEGDTIFVKNGTYYENVVVNKSLSLTAESRQALVIGGFSVVSNYVSLSGFSISANNSLAVGFDLNSSSNCRIEGNNIEAFGAGIVISGGLRNIAVNNHLESCSTYGIMLKHTNNNVIMGNSMNSHTYSITLTSSNNNHILLNTFEVHWGTICIDLHGSNNNTFEGNSLLSSLVETGIQLSSSNSNMFFHNNILLSPPAFYFWSSNVNNTWDNGCEGNYWSDYETRYPNANYDEFGIWDTPYVIDGNNQDDYPLRNLFWNPADTNHDLIVDIFDVVTVTMAYWKPWDPGRFCHIDIAEPYGQIDIYDVVAICIHYGEEYTS